MLIPEKPLHPCRRGNRHPPRPTPDTFSVSPTPASGLLFLPPSCPSRPPFPVSGIPRPPLAHVSPASSLRLSSRRPRPFPALRPAIMRKSSSFPHPPAPNLPGTRKNFRRPLTGHAGTLKIRRKSQGGVQVPTGGEPFGAARGRVFKGKAQIRCKSGADGNSPEERERIFRLSPLKHSPLS